MKDDVGFILPLGRQMLNLPFTYAEKRDLARQRTAEREERCRLEAAGYRKHETDWEIHRGGRRGERIVDAVISCDGMYVWTKLGPAALSTPDLSARPASDAAPERTTGSGMDQNSPQPDKSREGT